MSSPQRKALARLIAENPHLDPTGGDGAGLGREAGFSEKTAGKQVSRCMKDPRFQAMLERARTDAEANAAPVSRRADVTLSVDATDLADIRQRTVARMLQLAEQEENLNVTYKACEWLGRYSRAIEYAKGKDDAAQAVTGGDTMDPEVAKAVRKAKREAERELARAA